YLEVYLCINEGFNKNMSNDIHSTNTKLNELINMEYGNFTNNEMMKIMYSKLLVDIEQNIFRTKIRDYSNTEKVDIALIYNAKTYDILNFLIEDRFNVEI